MPGLICVTLIGTNTAIFVSTSLWTGLWKSGGDSLRAEMMATLTLTPILFVFAEVLPKNLFNAEADRLMYGGAGVLGVLRRTFGAVGLVGLLKSISRLWNWVRGLRRGASPAADPFPAQARLRSIIRDSAAEGIMTAYQNELVEKIMGLRDVHVADALVPAQRVVQVRADLPLGEFRQAVRAQPFSRMPVTDPSSGDAIGIVVVNDVLARMHDGVPLELIDFVRLPVTLAPTMTVTQAIVAMQRSRAPMAIVRGGGGQYLGIVTLKDLAEEIVGELEAW
jgi:CBS domain containing-hemolysin-like protein